MRILIPFFDATDYHDVGVISGIYEDIETFGEEEADSLGVFSNHDSTFQSVLERCFNYEEFGRMCLDNDYAIELNDGRVVTLYC